MTASGLRTFLFMTSALLAVAIAQAQQPPAGSKAAGAATTSSIPATLQSAQKAAADTKTSGSQPTQVASAQKPDSDAQLIKDARSAGFKPENVRGTMMFCRTAIELGSSFPVRTCYNDEQVKIKIHEYQTQRNQLEQMHNTGMMTH
jgi:hypothetical protein